MDGGVLAGGTPGSNIEVLPPDQPVHPAFLRSTRYESESLAGTVSAGRVHFLSKEGLIMVGQVMSAEALGVSS